MSTEDTQVVEATSSTETVVTDTVEETVETPEVVEIEETTEAPQEETVPKSQYAQVLARAKKAEAALKAVKPAPATPVATPQNSPVDVDVRILKAQGMPDKLIESLKKVASVNGTDILSAQTDPIFLGLKEKFEKEQKSQKASLGASRGSGGVKAKVTAETPNLSPEDHKAIWKEKMGL